MTEEILIDPDFETTLESIGFENAPIVHLTGIIIQLTFLLPIGES